MTQVTTNYDLFHIIEENRDVSLADRQTKNLAESMRKYGWLEGFPLIAKRNGKGLVVVDGQHRLQIAQEYNLPVKYIVEKQEIDIAELNNTAKPWKPIDYAKKYAKAGKTDYQELVDFYEKYAIPIMSCVSLLSGASFGGNVTQCFYNGTFQVKNRPRANAIAQCYTSLIEINPRLKKNGSIKALLACFRVKYFDPQRLIDGARRHASTIRSMPDTDSYLELFEEIYNHGKRTKHPLKFDAREASKAT